MTVVPVFCSRFIQDAGHHSGLAKAFTRVFERLQDGHARVVERVLIRPAVTLILFAAAFAGSLCLFPLLGLSFFPRTDAGQFVIAVKAASRTRLAATEKEIDKLESLVRQVVAPEDMGLIVSNIGVDPRFSAIYTANSAMHTAFVQVSLKPGIAPKASSTSSA